MTWLRAVWLAPLLVGCRSVPLPPFPGSALSITVRILPASTEFARILATTDTSPAAPRVPVNRHGEESRRIPCSGSLDAARAVDRRRVGRGDDSLGRRSPRKNRVGRRAA